MSQLVQCTIRPELIEFDKNTNGDFYLTVVADPGNNDIDSSYHRDAGFIFMNSNENYKNEGTPNFDLHYQDTSNLADIRVADVYAKTIRASKIISDENILLDNFGPSSVTIEDTTFSGNTITLSGDSPELNQRHDASPVGHIEEKFWFVRKVNVHDIYFSSFFTKQM